MLHNCPLVLHTLPVKPHLVLPRNSLWSLSRFARIIPNWLEWSLFFSVLPFFPFWSLLRLAFIKFLSRQWLQPTLCYWHVPIHRSIIQALLVGMPENTHVLLQECLLTWLAAAVLNQRPLNSYKNLTNKEKLRKEQRVNRGKWLFYKMKRCFFFLFLFFWYGMVSYEEKSHIQINNDNEEGKQWWCDYYFLSIYIC